MIASKYYRLRQGKPPIDHQIGPRHITRRIRSTKEINLRIHQLTLNVAYRLTYPFKLIWRSKSFGRHLTQPLIPHFRRRILHHLSLDIARRDAINATEIHPFHCEGLGELQDSGFGGIILTLYITSYSSSADIRGTGGIPQPVVGAYSRESR